MLHLLNHAECYCKTLISNVKCFVFFSTPIALWMAVKSMNESTSATYWPIAIITADIKHICSHCSH